MAYTGASMGPRVPKWGRVLRIIFLKIAVEEEITAILERAVSPEIVSCCHRKEDSSLEIIEKYFSKYQDEKREWKSVDRKL
jgi:hypothetical protein